MPETQSQNEGQSQTESEFLQFTCRTNRPSKGLQGILLRQVYHFS